MADRGINSPWRYPWRPRSGNYITKYGSFDPLSAFALYHSLRGNPIGPYNLGRSNPDGNSTELRDEPAVSSTLIMRKVCSLVKKKGLLHCGFLNREGSFDLRYVL